MIRLFLIVFFYGIRGQMLGPADITLTRLEHCAEDSQGVVVSLLKHKVNRTHDGIDLNITTPHDMDDQVAVNITVAKWGDGGWKPNFVNLADNYFCEFLFKYGEKPIKELFSLLGIPPKCPVSAGVYSVTNYIYDGYLDKPVLYGDFRSDLIISRKGIQVTCIRLFLNTKPMKIKFGR